MKRVTRILLTLALAGALLCGGALAATDGSLTVQLDGKELTFPDAQPQMKDGRTFLPVRALFEAMGAQVDYNSETCVVTAVRGDRTVTMALGSDEVTVTEGGRTETIEMDVVPYVDVETWRTYVPVRFAAQALNCAVGWEQSSYTVIIVDTEKVVARALEGKRFTYLDKLKAFAGRYDEGIWDLNADMSTGMSMLTMPVFTMEGTMKGTLQDAEKASLRVDLKADLSRLSAMPSFAGNAVDPKEQALLESLSAEGMSFQVRVDQAAGAAYVNVKGLALAGADPDAWYKADQATLDGTDLSVSSLGDMGKTLDLVGMLTDRLGSMELSDSANSYAEVKTLAEGLCAAFADESFKVENGVCAAAYSMTVGETKTDCYLSLTMKGETVTGFQLSVINGDTATSASTAVTMTADGKLKTETVQLSGGGLITTTSLVEGTITPGATAPETTPPAGAAVRDMSELGDLDDLMGVMPISGKA